MRYLLNSIKLPNLIQGIDAGRKTSMETENLAFDNCCKREIVEKFCEVFPDISITILAKAFIIKAITKVKVRESMTHTLR